MRPFVSAFALVLAFGASAFAAEGEAPKYRIVYEGSSTVLQSGAEGTFRLQIQPAEGFEINPKAPLKIELSGQGLALEKTKLGHDDAEKKGDHAPAFSVALEAEAPGSAKVEGTAMFFVCNEDMCERKTEKVQFSLRVDAPHKP